MAITSVTKDTDAISYVEDGVTKKISVSGSDTIVSFPIDSCDRIINMYRQQSDGHLIIAYFDTNGDKQEIEIAPTVAPGDMLKSVYDTDEDGIVDNSEELGGDTLAEVETTMDNKITTHTSGASAHHTKYTDAEAIMWAIVFGG